MMDLRELIKEVNYQDSYNYDKRVFLFNKYGISAGQEFFNPIYELTKFILNDSNGNEYSMYSHSAYVASCFNDKIKTKNHENIKVFDNGVIQIFRYIRYRTDKDKTHTVLMTYFPNGKTVKIFPTEYERGINVRRGLYESIDEWLVDFGFEKW